MRNTCIWKALRYLMTSETRVWLRSSGVNSTLKLIRLLDGGETGCEDDRRMLLLCGYTFIGCTNNCTHFTGCITVRGVTMLLNEYAVLCVCVCVCFTVHGEGPAISRCDMRAASDVTTHRMTSSFPITVSFVRTDSLTLTCHVTGVPQPTYVCATDTAIRCRIKIPPSHFFAPCFFKDLLEPQPLGNELAYFAYQPARNYWLCVGAF